MQCYGYRTWQYNKGTTFNSVAQFKCDTGYIMTGNRSTTCLANGEWEMVNTLFMCLNTHTCTYTKIAETKCMCS